MKRDLIQNPLFLLICGASLCGFFYLIINLFLKPGNYFYGLFFGARHMYMGIQIINSTLFGAGISFMVLRYWFIKGEEKVLKLQISRETTISVKDVEKEINNIPKKYRETKCARRLSDLLRGYKYKEEIIGLNEVLSRRDMDQIGRSHLFLNNLRQLIPLLGFVGTVFGLSLAMLKFPEITKHAGDVGHLKDALKDFAASLSVAFDTTLLALGYAILVALASSPLRRKEENLVAKIDEKTRDLISILKSEDQPGAGYEERIEAILSKLYQDFSRGMEEWLYKWGEQFSLKNKEFLEQLTSHNGNFGEDFAKIVRENGNLMAKKLDEIKQGLHEPPHYQIIVQPLKETE